MPPKTTTLVTKTRPLFISSRLMSSTSVTESSYLKDPHLAHSFCSKALKISAQMGFLLQGKQVHAHLINAGLFSVLALQNQILHLYVKCREFSYAHKLFDEMLMRNLVTWNTMICGLADCGSKNEPSLFMGFCYFKIMLLDQVGLDSITFNGLLRACIEINDVEIGRQLHCFTVKLGFELNCFVNTALVDLYGKCGFVKEARCVFDKVSCRDLVLWNVMVSCYALNSLAEEAFGVFNLMRMEGLIADGFTFSSLLSSCGTLGCCELGRQILGLIIKLSFDSDVLVASGLVDMYAKNGNIDDARKVFDGMAARNVVSWNTMVVGYGRHGDQKEATKLLRQMFQEDFSPDELTLASILSSCGNASVSCEIKQVHAYVVKNGFEDFLSIANALINVYSKCGQIVSALQCFSSVSEPDLVTWTSLICAYAFHGLPKDSIKIFEKMLSSGVRPDRIAFVGVLSACSHAGLLTKGLHYFSLMLNDYKIVPDLEHYTSLIDLLGRAGLLDEAFNVLTSTPIEHGSDMLGAFVGACKVHGYVQLAKRAAEKLFELEPNNPVNYTLMSNMFASEGNWWDVARVRKLMRDRCDHKILGCSWVEVAGAIHVFASGDKWHPQTLEVYSILGTLLELMKEEYLVSQLHAMCENVLEECDL